MKLKPLQWSNNREPCEKCRYNHVVADSGLGEILIAWKGWKEFDSYTAYVNGEHLGDATNLVKAKLMVEQHMQRVVLSMIEAPPSPQGDAQCELTY